ncbi:rod shape-determining protein MreD [Alicyclobacillaceae bacterium I2511]|nr:rod shape-determining protein MreD [Alicyclobacillaceae bacterium I2511]
MKNLLAFIFLWTALLVQVAVFAAVPGHWPRPDLVLVVLVMVSLLRGPRVSLILGVVIGAIVDVNYNSFIGMDAFAYGFIGYFAAVLLQQFLHRNIAVTFLVLVSCTFIFDWMTYGMTRLLAVSSLTLQSVMTHTIAGMIVNGVCLLLLYSGLVRWLSNKPKQRYGEAGSDS